MEVSKTAAPSLGVVPTEAIPEERLASVLVLSELVVFSELEPLTKENVQEQSRPTRRKRSGKAWFFFVQKLLSGPHLATIDTVIESLLIAEKLAVKGKAFPSFIVDLGKLAE